jgi:trimethylamine--corrinoid protein Co-methyltransferase
MITGDYWQLHERASLERLDGAAVRLLTGTGCRIPHEGLLARLEAAGCRVDRGAQRCYFSETLIREALGHLAQNPAPGVEIPAGRSPRPAEHQGGNFPHLLEWPSGRRRLATAQDVVDMARLGHVLGEFSTVGKVLTCSYIDQRVEPLWSAVTLSSITDKPIGGGEIFYPELVEPLVRMGEVLSGIPGDSFLVSSCDFFISPLVLDGKQAACFLEKRRVGLPNVPGTMAISGISAPVTLAGTVAVALAELIAGWTIGYVVDPSLPAGGITATGSLDLRTMAACFGSPEALLQDATVVQASRRLYGIPVWAAVGYVDCKHPGLEATFQKMLPLVAAPFGLSRLPGGGGLLSAGQDYSPVQHLLDLEMSQAVQRFWASYEISEDTLALELVESVCRAPRTDFLSTDHTFSHYRAEQWYPRWLDRTLWQGTSYEIESEPAMLARIDAYCQEARARYEPPDPDQAKQAELERILRTYERQLPGISPTPLPV